MAQQLVRIIVPFTAGTGPDLLARILGEELRQRWNETAIVENKPGASGNIGTQAAARANPDGQTLLVTANTFVMNASLYRSLPYDPEKSFLPIAELATGALALAVNPSTNINSLPELIDLARKKPGEINYASPGRGTPQHLAMELWLRRRCERPLGWSGLSHVSTHPYRAPSRGKGTDSHSGRRQWALWTIATSVSD
jgi:tripartite-type tricarboxylate transporter receptor subunit TctC